MLVAESCNLHERDCAGNCKQSVFCERSGRRL